MPYRPSLESLRRVPALAEWAGRAGALVRSRPAEEPPPAESAGGGPVTAEQLRRAIREGELVVHYQPVVATDDGRIAGVEALVRWEQPERGLRHPGAFIALLRDPEVARPLDEFVLRAACGFVRDLQPDAPGLWLTVNITRGELLGGTLVESVGRVLDETGLEPSLLELEVDEEDILGEEDRVMGILQGLRDLGVRIGLDGVGSDDASLEHVRRLPIDAVKVDMRIAARADAVRESLVGTVEAARERGLPVTAKRAQHPKRMAEDPEEQQLFADVRPDFVQSYAYGEPGPPVAIWKALAAVGTHAPPRPPQPAPAAPPVEKEPEPPTSASIAPAASGGPSVPLAMPARPPARGAQPRLTSAMVRLEPRPDDDAAEALAERIGRRPEVEAVSVLSQDADGCWLWVTASSPAALLAVVEEVALLERWAAEDAA